MESGLGAWLLVDGGTTRTRVWASRGDEVLAALSADIGARDVAREGSAGRLRAVVEGLLVQAAEIAAERGAPPRAALAAGMITSPQGWAEVPHVAAPADAGALAAGACRVALAALPEVPLWLVPGVRSGPARLPEGAPWQDVLSTDVMRGEEILALGLFARGALAGGGTFLNLGSHWKAIPVDATGRIAGSVSTLSGELIAAVHRETILAGSLPAAWPSQLNDAALAAGARAATQAGLSRALYAVRLLDLRSAASADERFAFLVGAVMEADARLLVPSAVQRVLVVGGGALGDAWVSRLRAEGRDAALVPPAEVEAAFRAGCQAVAGALSPGARP